MMNKYLYRAKLKEIRDAAKDPAGPKGTHPGGKQWFTTRKVGSYSSIKLKGDDATIRLVFNTADLYIQGFTTPKGSFKFTDATWNIGAKNIGYGGAYRDIGWERLTPYKGFTVDDVSMAINNIANCSTPKEWDAHRGSVAKLVIAFAEGARMHTVQDWIENGRDIPNVDWGPEGGKVLALVKG
jgi:Ribosome inactivating protein.